MSQVYFKKIVKRYFYFEKKNILLRYFMISITFFYFKYCNGRQLTTKCDIYKNYYIFYLIVVQLTPKFLCVVIRIM